MSFYKNFLSYFILEKNTENIAIQYFDVKFDLNGRKKLVEKYFRN